jgi:hypothetical protein
LVLAALLTKLGSDVWADPTFINGLTIDGGQLDHTHEPGANGGRLGFFSDIYYNPAREEWWALSDRGPGGGVLNYPTRVQRFKVKVNSVTGEISEFKVKTTIKFTDPQGLLSAPTNPDADPTALNGLNPLGLNGSVGTLGRSFDPEGLVINPLNGNMIVSDEYGPSVYEFDSRGRLVGMFETPANFVPKVDGSTDYVAERGDGLNAGRQDNRGFEGLTVTPDGKKLFAVPQDPLVNEPPPNNGRDGRNLRIVVFDNDPASPTYRKSIAQYAYQLELQADVAQRILDAGGEADEDNPRQGRNIGLSAIVALNDHQFLVLERDNRGIGVDDPEGEGVIGTKRVYKIEVTDETTDISGIALPEDGDLAGASITPVEKSEVFIDLAADTVLPNGKKPEKWEGLTIGPKLKDGSFLMLAGTDNDYSVTQNDSSIQFDVYVDFNGNSVQRDLDQPTMFEGVEVGPVPAGYVLIPGVLHAYKASAADLAEYERPVGSKKNK